MNEFDEWARTNMVDDTGYIEAYGRMEQAYLAGATAMREKCAEVVENRYKQTPLVDEETCEECAAAIRNIEVE